MNIKTFFLFTESELTKFESELSNYSDQINKFNMNTDDKDVQSKMRDLIQPPSENESKENENTSQLSVGQQLIDEIKCDIVDADLNHDQFIQISANQKIHKTTYIKSLFDKKSQILCRQNFELHEGGIRITNQHRLSKFWLILNTF